MLEHVGKNGYVELAIGVELLQVGLNHLGDPRSRHFARLAARLDAGHPVAESLDVLRGRGKTAADIENVFAGAISPKAQQPPIHIFEVLILTGLKHGLTMKDER